MAGPVPDETVIVVLLCRCLTEESLAFVALENAVARLELCTVTEAKRETGLGKFRRILNSLVAKFDGCFPSYDSDSLHTVSWHQHQVGRRAQAHSIPSVFRLHLSLHSQLNFLHPYTPATVSLEPQSQGSKRITHLYCFNSSTLPLFLLILPLLPLPLTPSLSVPAIPFPHLLQCICGSSVHLSLSFIAYLLLWLHAQPLLSSRR
ncbi:hypothetical protein BT69DRAFT_153215 [Atractiella rhizophila]|nr:hypothetical protein BT69DRAFT_153215 [Atractiella rhizophila]